MKKRFYHMFSFIFIISSSILLTNVFWQWLDLWNTNTILNTDINSTVDTNNGNWTIWDPIREWAYQIIHSSDGNHEVLWLIDDEITNHDTALSKTLAIINNIINYALWLLSLVALIYLILHGFMMITAGGDDTKYKQWLDGIKHAAVAIAGIWLSWFIISFIFWIIKNLTTN